MLAVTHRNADTKWFDDLYLEHAQELYWMALAWTDDVDLAKDAVQEAFVYLWEHTYVRKEGANLRAYLVRCVHNYITDYYRHEQIKEKHRPHIEEEIRYETIVEEDMSEEFRRAKALLESLPETCRKIFVQAVIEGKSYREVAAEAEISVNTVKTQIKIAYRKLREKGGNMLSLLVIL